ncbi:MAG: hypothetical protein WBM70_08085 [Sulfurovum sp.]|uniref:hypothetical protein n=1 Tax=Sulfurovum sp. TaxID=1969726 RepID=UPI003C77646D
MYERKENIPEENLDWEKGLNKVDHPETDAEKMENKHVIHPAIEHNNIVFQKKFIWSQANIKKTIQNIFDEHGEVSLLFGLLTLPYVIGFIVVAFILLYGGVPIDRFFSLKEGIFHFELWSIGAYIFITVGVIWLVVMLFQQRR